MRSWVINYPANVHGWFSVVVFLKVGVSHPERVNYKLCMLTHRCLLGKAPRYLSEYCVPVAHVAHSPESTIGIINWLYHDIDSAHTADVHLLSRALWPSTPCLIICVIHQSTLQRLRDHWKLTCSLLISTLSALEVLPRNALDQSTYLLTYLLTKINVGNRYVNHCCSQCNYYISYTLLCLETRVR